MDIVILGRRSGEADQPLIVAAHRHIADRSSRFAVGHVGVGLRGALDAWMVDVVADPNGVVALNGAKEPAHAAGDDQVLRQSRTDHAHRPIVRLQACHGRIVAGALF